MGFVLLITLLFFTSTLALFRPHVGVFAYAIMSIMAPQYIWFWVFDGIPAFNIVAGSTIIAFGISLAMRRLDLSVYKHRQNLLLLVLWIWVHLSDFFTPFPDYSSFAGSTLVLNTFDTIFIMYFVSLPLITKKAHLKTLCILFIVMFSYYVYWSNEAYFNFNPALFGYNNRLSGPFGSPYRDENVFATFFVMGMPFLLFGLFYFKRLWVKCFLLIVLLMSLHSIILTGSRGAMVAISIVVIFSFFLIKNYIFRILLILGFLAAILHQGGEMLSRTTDTLDAAQEQTEKPIDPRLLSWDIAIKLTAKYPIFGVGVQRFQEASRTYFPEHKARVAHNTLFWFTANTGLITGLIFLYLFYLHFQNFRFAIKKGANEDPLFSYLNNAFMLSLTGFYVCSVFLDLIIFEGFYFILLVSLIKDQLFRLKLLEPTSNENTTKNRLEFNE